MVEEIFPYRDHDNAGDEEENYELAVDKKEG